MSESLEQLLRSTFREQAAHVHMTGDLASSARARLREQRQRRWTIAGAGLTVVAIAVGIGVAAAVVGDRAAPPAAPASPTAASPTAIGPEPELAGTDWVLVEFTINGQTTAVPADIDSDLQFDGKGHFWAKACNFGSGEAELDGQQLRLRGGPTTDLGCSGLEAEVQDAVFGVLTDQSASVDPETWARAQREGRLQWTIGQHRLVLRAPRGDALVYQVRDPMDPTRNATTIVAGERAGVRYRVALGTYNGRDRVFLATRRPGGHWEVNGLDASVSGPMDSFLLNSLGDEDMVAGAVPSSTVRVIYRDPALTGGTELQLYRVDGDSWRVFAGFVPHTGTIVTAPDTITAYDADGQIVATCPSAPDAPLPRCTP